MPCHRPRGVLLAQLTEALQIVSGDVQKWAQGKKKQIHIKVSLKSVVYSTAHTLEAQTQGAGEVGAKMSTCGVKKKMQA